ncbi:unnamed protein product [Amoebophrya sp. A120]|nr:unnamed protein product [Amoebophrya sp. A120]|eukprot:GSA120T00012610001.1
MPERLTPSSASDINITPRFSFSVPSQSSTSAKPTSSTMQPTLQKLPLDKSPIAGTRGGQGGLSPSLSTTRSLFGDSDPFALMEKSLNRHMSAKSKRDLRLFKDPQDPRCHEYYRARFPDFDEFLACLDTVDYKYECEHDAKFADRYRIPDTQDPVLKLKGHLKGVDSCCWLSANVEKNAVGKTFISGGHDGLRFWSTAVKNPAGAPVAVEQELNAMPSYDLCLSADEKLCLSGGPSLPTDFPETKKGTLALYSVNTAAGVGKKLQLQAQLSSKMTNTVGNLHTVDMSRVLPNLAVCGDSTGRCSVVDLQKGGAVWSWDCHIGYTDPVTYVGTGSAVTKTAFSQATPTVFATAGKDGHVRLWDARVNQSRGFWLAASTLANRITLQTGIELLHAHDRQPVLGLYWLEDDRTLLTCGGDNKAKKWDLRMSDYQGNVAESFLGHIAPVRSVSASPDKKYVSTACEDGSVRIFRVNDLQIRKEKLRTVLEKRKRLESESDVDVRTRMRAKYTETAKAMSLEVHRIKQDGFSDGMLSLIGHSLGATNVAWMKDPLSSRPDRYRVLTSSWDQTCNIHDLDLAESTAI